MDLTRFLEDLKTYKIMFEEDNVGMILTHDYMVEHIEGLIEDLKHDHLMGEADEASRDDE